jgi:hypothetical protein
MKILKGEHDGLSGRNVTDDLKELIFLMMHVVWIYMFICLCMNKFVCVSVCE